MPEHMRRELVGEADNCAPVANHAIGALTAQPPTALVEKDRLGVAAPGPTVRGQLSPPTNIEPAFECRRGHPTERNDAFLDPLPMSRTRPSCRSTSLIDNPTTSEIRAPVP